LLGSSCHLSANEVCLYQGNQTFDQFAIFASFHFQFQAIDAID